MTTQPTPIDRLVHRERSQALRYGVMGAVAVFCVVFPVTTFVIGAAMGLPMAPGTAAMFALAGAVTFGLVAGMVAGAAERADPAPPGDGKPSGSVASRSLARAA